MWACSGFILYHIKNSCLVHGVFFSSLGHLLLFSGFLSYHWVRFSFSLKNRGVFASCLLLCALHDLRMKWLFCFLSPSPVMNTLMCLCTDWLPRPPSLPLSPPLRSTLHAELIRAWHLSFPEHLTLSLVLKHGSHATTFCTVKLHKWKEAPLASFIDPSSSKHRHLAAMCCVVLPQFVFVLC